PGWLGPPAARLALAPARPGWRSSPGLVLVVIPAEAVVIVAAAAKAVIGDGQGEGVAHGVPVPEQVDGVAAFSNAVRLQERTPLLERAASLARHLANVGDVS